MPWCSSTCVRKNCSQTFTSPSKLFFASNMVIILNDSLIRMHSRLIGIRYLPMLCLAAGEAATDSGDEDASIATADSVDSSTDQDTQVQALSFVVSFTLLHYHVDCVEYPYQCTLRLWYLETPMTLVQRTGTAPLIDCIRRFSVCDPTRPRR